jgi:hypothetical protein
VAVFHAFSRVVNEARSAFVVLDTAPTGHSLLLMDATGAYHRQVMQQYEGMANRVQCEALRRKLVPVEEAVRHVRDGDTLAVSGFTKAGEPKVFMPALARHLATLAPRRRRSRCTAAPRCPRRSRGRSPPSSPAAAPTWPAPRRAG